MRNKFIFGLVVILLVVSFATKTNAGTLPPQGLNSIYEDYCLGGTPTSTSPTDLSHTTLPKDIGVPGRYCVSEVQTDSCSHGPTTYQTNVYVYSGDSFNINNDLANQGSGGGCQDQGGPPSFNLYQADFYPAVTTSLSADPSTIYQNNDGSSGSALLTPDVVLGGVDESQALPLQPLPSGLRCSINNGVGSYTGTNAPFSVTPTTTTTYTLSCAYNGGTPSTAQATVTVVPPLANNVTCSVAPTSVATGTPVTWTAVMNGGKSPFSFLWAGDGFLAGKTTNPVSGFYYGAGTKSGTVTVTDSSNQPSQTTVTENQNNDEYCTGSPLGSMSEIDDGDDQNGDNAHSLAAAFPAAMYSDPNFGPPAFHANPQNYCVSEIASAPRCQQNPPNCSTNAKAILYSGATLAPIPAPNPDIFQAATWTVTQTPSTGPAVVTEMCSNTVIVTGIDQPPPPVLNCPSSAVVNSPLSFIVSGTDPAGEQINYGGDWNNDQTVDTWMPSATTYVDSGTPETFSTTSPKTAGNYVFEALTQNTDGTQSAWASCTVPITAAQPDLTAADVISPAPTAGTPVTLSAIISNSNVTTTGAAFTDLFQVANDSIGSGATDIGTFANSKLAASATKKATNSYTFPAPGTFYLRVCADKSSSGDTGVITESNEHNNCSPDWVAVTVTGPAITSCNVSNSSPPLNTPVTYTATPGPGATGPYTWTPSSPSMCTTGTGTTANCTFTVAGPYSMQVAGANTSSIPCQAVTADVPTPTATLTANPTLVGSGETTALTWTSTNATSCTMTRNGNNWTTPGTLNATSGTKGDTTPITVQTTYIVNCSGATATAIVNVVPSYQNY